MHIFTEILILWPECEKRLFKSNNIGWRFLYTSLLCDVDILCLPIASKVLHSNVNDHSDWRVMERCVACLKSLKGKSTLNTSDHDQVLQLIYDEVPYTVMFHRPFCKKEHPSPIIVWNIAHSMRRSMRINSQNIKENRQKSAFTLAHECIFRLSFKTWLATDIFHPSIAIF